MIEPRRKPYRNLLVAGVALALAILVTAGVKSWNDLQETRAREHQLERQIAEAEQRIESLTDHVQRLEEDPVALERAVREELGFVLPEDVVIVLPTPEAPSAEIPSRAWDNRPSEETPGPAPETARSRPLGAGR